jgi:hypothetical protein
MSDNQRRSVRRTRVTNGPAAPPRRSVAAPRPGQRTPWHRTPSPALPSAAARSPETVSRAGAPAAEAHHSLGSLTGAQFPSFPPRKGRGGSDLLYPPPLSLTGQTRHKSKIAEMRHRQRGVNDEAWFLMQNVSI